MLLWYYSTLTLQEHILMANGSRYEPNKVVYKYLVCLFFFIINSYLSHLSIVDIFTDIVSIK